MITKIHGFYIVRFLLLPMLIVGLLGIHPSQPVLASATVKVLNTNDSGPGSLRQVITNAAAGDTIVFDTSLSAKTIVLASTLVINKNVTIDGSSLASKITISGNNKVRVFDVAKPEIKVTLNSLKIVNGLQTASEGGGLGNRGTLTIKNCVFSRNSAKDGGAIINGGTLSILNTAFTDNVAAGSSPNAVSFGGAIFNWGTLIITNSTFTGNTTNYYGSGGAIENGDILSISNSRFIGNHANMGGASG